MASLTIKRIIAGAVGLLYALVYGFWTMLITGGGHGNFVWFFMFVLVEFFGIYIPLMAVLAVDLKSRIKKMVFGSLIGFNVIASTIILIVWISDWYKDPGENFVKIRQSWGTDMLLFVRSGILFRPSSFLYCCSDPF